MFRKICNYAAILSLSLVFTSSVVFGNYPLSTTTKKNKTTKVSNNKKFTRYSTNIPSNETHNYKVTAELGKNSNESISSMASAIDIKPLVEDWSINK